MLWNHRVIRHKSSSRSAMGSPNYLCIHEVYFEEGMEDKPHSVTKDGVTVGADLDSDLESIADMRETLHRMLRALDKPIIDFDTIGGEEEADVETLDSGGGRSDPD